MSDPISVEQALSIVLDAAPILPFESIDMEKALGRFLQEDIRADHDHPDFDKSLMDGYAVIASELGSGLRPLRVVQEIPAGMDPARLRPVLAGSASRIMTGPPIPPGADAVLMVEEAGIGGGSPGSRRPKSAGQPGAPRPGRGP